MHACTQAHGPTHTNTNARMYARTHARMHARTHTQIETETKRETETVVVTLCLFYAQSTIAVTSGAKDRDRHRETLTHS